MRAHAGRIRAHDAVVDQEATSLITFGFSVYKFFQFEKPTNGSENRLVGPREFALTLVSIGLFSLVSATLESAKFSNDG
jgi:hypothetical protein